MSPASRNLEEVYAVQSTRIKELERELAEARADQLYVAQAIGVVLEGDGHEPEAGPAEAQARVVNELLASRDQAQSDLAQARAELEAVRKERDALAAMRDAVYGQDAKDGCCAPGEWCCFKPYSELAVDHGQAVARLSRLEAVVRDDVAALEYVADYLDGFSNGEGHIENAIANLRTRALSALSALAAALGEVV